MKIVSETSVRNFGFWSGGADRAKDIKCDSDWDIIESELESAYPEGMTDGELNDFFWFDFDTIAQWLGYKSEEHYFYGAAKDGDEMSQIIIDRFPDANSDAVDEWVDSEWEPNWVEEKCLNEFSDWYFDQYAKSRTDWVDRMFDDANGHIAQMKWFIKDKDLNEKTAEEWRDEYNQWLEDEADWIEEHEDEIFTTDYGF
jgi:hypothetical protein